MEFTTPQPEPVSISASQINAILSLLDDPDPTVQEAIQAHLLELGGVAAPALREVSTGAAPELARFNARSVLAEIGLRKLRGELHELLAIAGPDGDIDLERGAMAVAMMGYPEMRIEEYRGQLDTIAAVLETRLRGCDNGYMVAREINYYLFDQLGFHGCRQDRESIFNPEHSFLNRVLERRVGIPISLSVIYLLVARRLYLPFHGVAFPARYLAKYRSATEEFFIDPFNAGAIFNYSDCRRFLREINVEFRPEYLEPASNRRTIARMLRNLIESYQEREPNTASALSALITELIGEEDARPDAREPEE